MSKEQAGELKVAVFLRNTNHIEAQKHIFRHIRHMEGHVKGGSPLKGTTQVEGEIIEHAGTLSIEKLITEINEMKYHVIEGRSQLLSGEYTQALGHHGEGKDIHIF